VINPITCGAVVYSLITQIGIRPLIEVFLFSVPIFHIVAVLFGTHIVR